jgi:DNA repair photolyase
LKFYSSPRWSGEVLDCSLPMTFDTYNKCSYDCLYCFSTFQKMHCLGIIGPKTNYKAKVDLTAVDPRRVRSIFEFTSGSASDLQFRPYIEDRKTIQWGGLTDPFDENERRLGVGLEVMRYLRDIDYPVCFSTKGTWWTTDERYLELFRGNPNWNVKFSIINLDPLRARAMERGVDSPAERLLALERVSRANAGGTTLRLRPFILGLSDRNQEHLDLIRRAAAAGASAVSTEFFCLEARANDELKAVYRKMSAIVGYDIYEFYRRNSPGSGYRRLNRSLKAVPVDEMEAAAKAAGLRFYVSDAHFKERSHNCCCCGLDPSRNVQRGHFAEALLLAKNRPDHRVRWSDIEPEVRRYFSFDWLDAAGFNTGSVKLAAKFHRRTLADYIHYHWNATGSGKSPYRYFGGALVPVEVDERGDVVYEYREVRQ